MWLLAVGALALMAEVSRRWLPEHPARWEAWAAGRPPLDVIGALLTAVVLVAGLYVLAALTAALALSWSGVRPRPASGRVLMHLVAVGSALAAGGAAVGPGGVAGASMLGTPAGAARTSPVSGGAPRLWRVVQGAVSPPSAGATSPRRAPPTPVRRATPPAGARASRSSWVVEPGQSLWRIAELRIAELRIAELRSAAPGSDPQVVAAYWMRLMRANPQLADPDFIVPGEVLRLPPLRRT